MRLAAVLLPLAAGCGSDPFGQIPEVFHGDASATPAERVQVEAALAFMQMHVPPLERTRIAWDGAHDYPVSATIRVTRGGGGQTRIRPWSQCAITCGADLGFARCIAHELGHCAGLDHVEGAPEALTFPILTSDWLVWTQADLAECRRAGACP